MRIKQIDIKNFKNTKKMSVTPKKINISVGKNGVGKTTLLESIIYGVSGELPKDAITHGENEVSVKLTLGAHSIERINHVVESSKNKVKVNGSTTTQKALNEFFETHTGVSNKTARIVTSSKVVESLKPEEFSSLLMNHVEENLDADSIIEYATGITEGAKDYLLAILPGETFGAKEIVSLYEDAFEERRYLKREVADLQTLVRDCKLDAPKKTVEQIDKSLDEIAKKEGKVAAYKSLLKSYEQAMKLKKDNVEAIAKIKKEYADNKATKPDAEVLTKLNEREKLASGNIITLEKSLTAHGLSIKNAEKMAEALKNPVCVINSKIKCTVDKTETIKEQLDIIKAGKLAIDEANKQIEKNKKELEDVRTQKKAYTENESLYREKVMIYKQYQELNKKEITIPEKPKKIEEEDFSVLKTNLKKERENISLYSSFEKNKATLTKKQDSLNIQEELVRLMAPNGIVMENITKYYLDIFEDACNESLQTINPNFEIKLVSNKGVEILCKTHDEFIPYENTSSGEKICFLFAIMNMLNSLTGLKILSLDDLEKLDESALDSLVKLLSSEKVLENYDHIFINAVNHDNIIKVLKKVKGANWIF